MKVVAMSDLHGYLPEDVEPCDVVCICGDIVPLRYQMDMLKSVSWFITDFWKWADGLPCQKVIFTGGNHDFFLEEFGPKKYCSGKQLLGKLLRESVEHTKLVYLCDEGFEFEGKYFYGTPWCPNLHGWAFYKPSKPLKKIFELIPQTRPVDVLLTHAPAAVGLVGHVLQDNRMVNFGCEELAEVLQNRPNVKYALSGHIHSGQHRPEKIGDTTYACVSLKDESYSVSYESLMFEI